MITDQTYLNWQKTLKENKLFRNFWVFWGNYSAVLVFAAALYFLAVGRLEVIIFAFLSFVVARVIISPIIYLAYKKSRPYQRLNFDTFYSRMFSLKTQKSNAFPSDHAVSLAAISIAFYFFYPTLGLVFFGVTLLNGLGRMILGYHDFWDLLAGWAVGVLSAILILLSLYGVSQLWYYK